MRYPQGGGLTPERQARRERLRLEAAGRFAAGDDNVLIAKDLRVHVRSVQRWRKAWSEDGEAGLLSKGPVSLPVLSDELFAVLEGELDRGAVAHGWPDQTWTLARITTLIGRRFHKSCTPQGVAALLHRHGWSWQTPARRAIERDEQQVATWVKETWPHAEVPGRRSMPGSSSKTRPVSR
jgi:transposase